MTNDNANPDPPPTPAPRKRRGRTIFIDGPPERGNATAEELMWPVVACAPRGRSILIDGPPERGNATAEELTWPAIETGTGSEVISAPRPVPAPVAEPSRKPDRSWIWELLPEVRSHLDARLRRAKLDPSIADDLVHDAAIATYQETPSKVQDASKEVRIRYLKRKAFHRAAEYARTRFWTTTSADQLGSVGIEEPFSQIEATEATTLIKAILSTLPARERMILELHYFEERSHKEIGTILNIRGPLVSYLLSLAREHLRKVIATNFPELADALDNK